MYDDQEWPESTREDITTSRQGGTEGGTHDTQRFT